MKHSHQGSRFKGNIIKNKLIFAIFSFSIHMNLYCVNIKIGLTIEFAFTLWTFVISAR